MQDVSHGAQPDHKQAELGLRLQTLIFSQGRVAPTRLQKVDEPVDGFALVLDFNAQTGGLEREGFREARGQLAKASQIFLGGDQGCCTSLLGCGDYAIDIGWCEAVVVAKDDSSGDAPATGFNAGKKLRRPGNAAEGGYWAIGSRHVNPAMQPPDWAFPAPFAECGFKLSSFFWRGYGDYRGPEGSLARLAQIPGR
jgi:hypothetical protein